MKAQNDNVGFGVGNALGRGFNPWGDTVVSPRLPLLMLQVKTLVCFARAGGDDATVLWPSWRHRLGATVLLASTCLF